ncbi:MAG: L,D-transpeptidase family protein [Candidatus Hydrogenedentes bacterium]|nr:L,D-transpeptidase family protein [Candidatus Hydrogenedentota bacterium]
MSARKDDPSLTKIIIIILAIGAAGYGVWRGARWFNDEYIGGATTAKAPESLDMARTYIEEGRTAEAREVLRPIVARVKDDAIVVEALLLLADIEEKAGDIPAALDCLERAANEFPNSPEHPKAALAYARLLEQQGRVPDAVGVYEEVQASAPSELRAPALTGLGRQKERDGDLWGARELYRQAVEDAAWDSPAWQDALEALGKANVALLFSPAETPESKAYVVEKGDNLTNIGVKLNTTQGLLMRANGMTQESTLRLNQRLKYTPKEFRIVIERSKCRLFLLDKDGLFKCYRVGLGMPGHETTPGSYKIGTKQKDPTWYKPGAGPIPPGDPRNELGTRWMPLEPLAEGLPGDLGIHGTTDPGTVGQYSSHGCARMVMEEVEELYDLVVRSTPVDIVDVFQPDASN